jgi:hypothetical protein
MSSQPVSTLRPPGFTSQHAACSGLSAGQPGLATHQKADKLKC